MTARCRSRRIAPRCAVALWLGWALPSAVAQAQASAQTGEIQAKPHTRGATSEALSGATPADSDRTHPGRSTKGQGSGTASSAKASDRAPARQPSGIKAEAPRVRVRSTVAVIDPKADVPDIISQLRQQAVAAKANGMPEAVELKRVRVRDQGRRATAERLAKDNAARRGRGPRADARLPAMVERMDGLMSRQVERRQETVRQQVRNDMAEQRRALIEARGEHGEHRRLNRPRKLDSGEDRR